MSHRRMIAGLCALLFLLASLLPAAFAADDLPMESLSETDFPDPVGTGAALVCNIENGKVIYSHHADKVFPTASFAKMMTALCAYEALADRLDETLTVEYSQIKDATGNQVGYYVGETVTVRDLFGGLLVRGANDSAYLLGFAAAGDTEAFLARMNEKAAALGMTDTTYKNPTGMDQNGMVTTAQDTYLLAKGFFEIPFLTELSGGVKYEMPATNKAAARTLYNRNGIASRVVDDGYFDGRLVGLNAGSTAQAGYYAASGARKEELSYIIIVMAAEEIDGVNRALAFSSKLADFALQKFGYKEVIRKGQMLSEIPVRLSTDADYVSLVAAEPLVLYMPLSAEAEQNLQFSVILSKESLDAPVTEGQIAGRCTVSQEGVLLGEVDLVTRNSLSESVFLAALDSIERITKSTFFIVTVLTAVLLTAAAAYLSHRKKRVKTRGYRYSGK